MRAVLLVMALLFAGCVAPDAVAPASSDDVTVYPTIEDTPEAQSPEPSPSPEPAPNPTSTPAPKPSSTAAPEDTPMPEAWTRPAARPLPQPIVGLDHRAQVTGSGAGIALFGHYAFFGDYSPAVLHVVDIADPLRPERVATVQGIPVRDADIIAYGDGRLILVTASGNNAFFVTDVTDPTQPELLTTVQTLDTNHNLAVVPGTPLVYNSPSGGARTDIWDLSDPFNPTLVLDWNNGDNCHDIAFLITESRQRGYCAGLDVVQIWDVSDAWAPKVIQEFPFPGLGVEGSTGVSPATFAHLATPNHDGTVLMVGDETGGGAANGCDVYAESPAGTHSGPLGNVWFYDIENELDPQLRGGVSPSFTDGGLGCTAHFGRVVANTTYAVMGFYQAGVVLLDFQDLDNPRIVDRWDVGGSVWDAQPYQGYVFTGDMSRGLDVLTFA